MMAVECGVIIFIILLLALMFYRRSHKDWSLATFPLILLPLADLIIELGLIKMLKLELTAFAAILILVVAVAVSAAWIGAASANLRVKHSKRTAVTFTAIANIFDIALAAILISDILNRAKELEAIIH